ncbi:hypothetical protein [Thalassomonas sp. M1454]|uniref:hypothetical protein n=1 Tax=Thalassomonas sp. M1454 TaxID=2594477 RepID=UPI00117F4F88|nr:hypothetical protein [Thalassomonas sp. M1454]TRX55863.1 hypothetical protein FNN08_09605 [Thalassomonas sp. M1454]
MAKFSPYISIASLLLLSACGGGGGGSNSEPQPIGPFDFSLSSVLKNDCGVESPYTAVELVLQDQNWQTVSTHKPNAEGIIELTTNDPKINYTLIATIKKQGEDEGIEAVSFNGVDSASSAKFYATNSAQLNNASCECKTNDLVFIHNQLDQLNAAYSSATFASFERIDSNQTKFIGVKTCRNIEEEWAEHSFSVEGPSGNYPLVGLSGFGTGHEDLYDLYQAFNYNDLSDKNPELTFSQFFNGLRHFETEVAERAGTVLVFDNHKYTDTTMYNAFGTYTFDETSSGPLTQTTLNSEHETYNSDYRVALQISPSTNKPNIDLEYLSEIQDNGEYNFNVVNNYNMAIIRFDYLAKDPDTQLDMPATWTVYGPIEGSLPTIYGLPGYEDIISSDTSIKGTRVRLVQSAATRDYNKYIQYYAQAMESAADKSATEFAQERRFYNINVELK